MIVKFKYKNILVSQKRLFNVVIKQNILIILLLIFIVGCGNQTQIEQQTSSGTELPKGSGELMDYNFMDYKNEIKLVRSGNSEGIGVLQGSSINYVCRAFPNEQTKEEYDACFKQRDDIFYNYSSTGCELIWDTVHLNIHGVDRTLAVEECKEGEEIVYYFFDQAKPLSGQRTLRLMRIYLDEEKVKRLVDLSNYIPVPKSSDAVGASGIIKNYDFLAYKEEIGKIESGQPEGLDLLQGADIEYICRSTTNSDEVRGCEQKRIELDWENDSCNPGLRFWILKYYQRSDNRVMNMQADECITDSGPIYYLSARLKPGREMKFMRVYLDEATAEKLFNLNKQG